MSKKINQELEEISPLLSRLRDQGDGLGIPQNYFEDFDERLKQRLAVPGVRRQTLQSIDAPVKRRLWPGIFAIAASLVLVLGVVWFFKTGREVPEFASSELTSDEITAYLVENASDFEPEQLAALTENTDETNQSVNPENEPASPEKEEIPAEAVEEIIDEMTDEELAELL